MQTESMEAASNSLAKVAVSGQWALLIMVSVVLVWGMGRTGLPGALLLGPMAAGIIVGVNGGSIRVPPFLFSGTNAVLGCMIAGLVTRPVMAAFIERWPIFLTVTLLTVLAGVSLGWLLSSRNVLPGTTAIWGLSPGAATAMVVMSEAHGGDPRLVAFMQYLRVLCVALLASLIARFWVGDAGATRPGWALFPPLHCVPFLETLAIGGFGAALGRRLRIPSGTLLVPLVSASALQASGLIRVELPGWLLVATFTLLGWGIGLRFTRSELAYATRALPRILASTVALIVFCSSVAFFLSRCAGIDLLTAYLATSPGGVDSAAVISASTEVDMPFVMGAQTVRLFVMLLVGPPIARVVARRVRPVLQDGHDTQYRSDQSINS